MATWTLQNACFRTLFANQHVKGSKTLRKCAQQHVYANVPVISNKLSSVKCFLLGTEILRPISNTFTAAHIHSCHNWQNQRFKFKRTYHQTHQHFVNFDCFCQIYIKIWVFWKINHLHSFNMSEVIASEKCGYLNALKLLFSNNLR